MAKRKGAPEFFCTRSVDFTPVERNEENTDGRTLDGYAAVFGEPTRIASWEGIFDETIDRGAFSKTLSERKPIMQFDHGHDSRTGSVPIGVFTDVHEDEHGLRTIGRLHDNDLVEPIRQAIDSGAISGMSFRFRVVRDEWYDKNGKQITSKRELEDLLWEPGDRGPLKRNIKEVKLSEAGPVVFPAYDQTSVGVRSVQEPDDITRDAVVSAYTRSFPEDEELLEEREDAVEDVEPGQADDTEDTSEERTDEDPEDAATERGTSEGHEEIDRDDPIDEERKERVPMTLEEMRSRLAEIAGKQTSDEFRAEVLSDEAQTAWDGLEAERAQIEIKIAAAEERQARLATLAEGEGTVERGAAKGPAFHKKQTDEELFNLENLRDLSYSGEDFLRKVEENAKRAVERAVPGVERSKREDAQAQAMEHLEERDNSSRDLAKRYLLTGSPEYSQAFGKVLRHGSDAMCSNEERAVLIRAAQALSSDGAGGYAVPFQLDPSVILTSAGVVNPIRKLARVEQIVGKEWQGILSAGITVSRSLEGAEFGENNFTTTQPTLRTNRVTADVPFSIEIDLTWGALQSEITRMLVDAKAREENSFITGNGVGTNPGGVVGSLTGNTVTAGGVASLAPEDLFALDEALDPRWEENASLLAHKAFYNKVRQFDEAGGANLWASLGDGTPSRLLDYPNYRSSAMDSALTTGSKVALLGDFKQFLIVDRIGMQIELQQHVLHTDNNRWTGQRAVLAVWMNNSKILVDAAFKLLVTG